MTVERFVGDPDGAGRDPDPTPADPRGVDARELEELLQEQHLLWDLVALAQGRDNRLPLALLDAALRGTCAVRPDLPAPRRPLE